MTNRSVQFLRAVRERPSTLPELAERLGWTLDEAREVLHRGYDAKRLTINDKDRQHIVIEIRKADA